MVEEAARYPSDVQTERALHAHRHLQPRGRYDDALRVIRAVCRQRYPRNRLLWLEAGSTALRAKPAGTTHGARLEAGLAQLATRPRARALGEDARWGYTYGAALVALKDSRPAT